MIDLAEREFCTACGACAFVCPKHCISMEEDEFGSVYPIVDDSDCISCKRCQRVCPVLSPVERHEPKRAYAAWSSDGEERRTSASGGIAAEVYKMALEAGYYIAGAKQEEDFTVVFQATKSKELIGTFKNSKYVFSSAYALFPQVKKLLTQGERIVVIGLPCQIAALRNMFKGQENLLLMDVVCHGTTPHGFLMQHIHALEQVLGKKAVKMSFRDPVRETSTFTFTLYDSSNTCFYAQRTKDGDTYQFGYHRTVTYRENCYHCLFARKERISDVTLSDYKGLGKMSPCSYSSLKVSSVLVNTPKGEAFIRQLIENRQIFAEERPVCEPIEGDPQLRMPSQKKRPRLDFEKFIVEYGGDFERTMQKVMCRYRRRESIRRIIRSPKRLLSKIKRVLVK